jgi:alpha-amylase
MNLYFSKYSNKLNNDLKGYSVLNYMSSHDDGAPFDAKRNKNKETGTKLYFLSQVYYGDESARSLVIEGTQGDATLRSLNWDAIKSNPETQNIVALAKLGQFRKNHPSVGAGIHQISDSTVYFSRTFSKRIIWIK